MMHHGDPVVSRMHSKISCQSHSFHGKEEHESMTITTTNREEGSTTTAAATTTKATTTTTTKNIFLPDMSTAILVGILIGVSYLPLDASSMLPPPTMTFSNVVVAAEIKVLDMSLPSYSSISDPKSADLESLKKDPPKDLMMGKKITTSKDKGKKTTNKKEKESSSSTAATPKVSSKEDKGPAYEIVDMTLPSYEENTVGKGKEAFLI
jgi:hypothetical protein